MSVFNASLTMMNQGDNGSSEWQPLNDGYSNFWFELTNDTLSPWLRFSQKNSNAVIDWGDGSGEQSLDTLTPTHTYAKAGKYVVKVRGVTGIARQHATDDNYFEVLQYAELNDEIAEFNGATFYKCTGLKNIVLSSISVTYIPSFCFAYTSLTDINIPSSVTSLGTYSFQYNHHLRKVIIPSNITEIGQNSFQLCIYLNEIHIKATTPPTLGSNAFSGAFSNYVIYVPVGTGDTYKAARGWSDYSDHIVEEGQTPNRAMLAKFGSAGLGEEEEKPDNEEMR